MMMVLNWMIIILLEISLAIVGISVVENRSISSQESLGVGREATIHKHRAVKSIQSEDGDIIDCIDIKKQPAFDHPALRNHTIQTTPSYQSKTMVITATRENTKATRQRKGDATVTVTTQLWQRSGSCPKGTIPIRRMQRKNARKGNPTDNYGRHNSSFVNHDKQFDDNKKVYLLQPNHSLAILHAEGFRYLGAKGDIKVWNPQVESDNEYSTSRVALKSGPYYDFEAIESGWAVNPSVYGDRKTRLFVYWTVDASKKTGCFDLTCPGFVQTSNEIALGAAIYPISHPTGLPYQITIYIHQDPYTSNWWVQYGERINIGYWPPELFSRIRYHASTVQWGGEVSSPKVGTHPHTATAMGSGSFPDYIFGRSGYIKRMRVLENSGELRFPQWVTSYTDEYNCYEVYYVTDYVEDPEFYFGGPGRNPLCP